MLVGGGVVVLVVEGGGRVYTRDFGKSSLVGFEGVVAISFFVSAFFFVLFLSWRVDGNGGYWR